MCRSTYQALSVTLSRPHKPSRSQGSWIVWCRRSKLSCLWTLTRICSSLHADPHRAVVCHQASWCRMRSWTWHSHEATRLPYSSSWSQVFPAHTIPLSSMRNTRLVLALIAMNAFWANSHLVQSSLLRRADMSMLWAYIGRVCFLMWWCWLMVHMYNHLHDSCDLMIYRTPQMMVMADTQGRLMSSFHLDLVSELCKSHGRSII